MELSFGKNSISCLDLAMQEIRNSEQTQELKLSDGMPDIGHILCAWGQVILRTKEWNGGTIACGGGIVAWVLYMPEDGSEARCIDGWIPFHDSWDLPDKDVPEGDIAVRYLTRFVDARSVSPRRIMVRAGVSAMVSAYVPRTIGVSLPAENPEGIELLHCTYPVRVYKEMGEKTFVQDEEMRLTDDEAQPREIISYRIHPLVSECRVLLDKVVFRGNSCFTVIYRCEEGKLHSWQTELAFSQYGELEGEYSTDARAELLPCVTNMELELDSEGTLHLKCGMTAQYVVTDKEKVTLVEDAYSPGRELKTESCELKLPVVLETRSEEILGDQIMNLHGTAVVDAQFYPEFPRQTRTDSGVDFRIPGVLQVLLYNENGALEGGTSKWEEEKCLLADKNCRVAAVPVSWKAQAGFCDKGTMLKTELKLDLTTNGKQEINMLTALELGQAEKTDPARPSLILCRAGSGSLWNLAKSSGSTVDAIRRANGLQEDPVPGKMLLIPVL